VKRIVDLSMPVHMDMLTFPRVPPPALTVYESHEDFAKRIGAADYGVTSLTASYLVVQNDHVGTHLDARKHIVPTAGGPETIPLEYCISDGVLLDFTDKESGYVITADDVRAELDRIEYTLKERDIVLNHTGAGAYNTEERYRTDHPGMSGEATRWLISQGVRLMGWDEEYWHLENLMNLEQIGRPHGFQLCVLPVKWVGTTAAPVRAVAVIDE
jgi:kynurenine formamidase